MILGAMLISLWISVVSLCHHGVAYIFAGLCFGAFANWLTPILRSRWPKLAQ